MKTSLRVVCGLCGFVLFFAVSRHAIAVETLRAANAVPAELAGRFREPFGFQQSADGQYFVFDRRAQTVYGMDRRLTSVWPIVHIGPEEGRILQPTAFAVEPGGTFVVADAPDRRERVQIFTAAGFRIGGFFLPAQRLPRVVLDSVMLGGIAALQFTGTSILIPQPETGALFTEYTLQGAVVRSIGALRKTGHESELDVHYALNSGVPLVDPDGGFLFVFQCGEPVVRKYDRDGHLLFERRVEGREIDPVIASLPTIWPTRKTNEGELAVVSPTVRTAAVDRSGRLWISLIVPYTYVYDRDGDKIRSLQFRAAGIVSPTSLFFGREDRLLITPGLAEFVAP